ncbi:TIR domain-containing protein [Sorangium sp. So ce291]|uniref:TIR domain-containing protein n=1 Tax=Sorangium sp. So ce291 TaxID=3133294 RepID=UPI003F601AA3
MARVFLSHASVDKSSVRLIADALRAAGHEPWLDEEELLVGDSIPRAVERGLREADFVVVCLSTAATERGWVEAERDATMIQQFRERKARILPVRLEPVDPPYLLAQLAYVDLFPSGDAFRRGIDRLTRSIAMHFLQAGAVQNHTSQTTPIGAAGGSAGSAASVSIAHPGPPRGTARPVTVLFFGASPSDTTRIALCEEVRQIDQRLRGSEGRDVFRLEQAWAVRATDIQERLLRHRPSIVHFSGHGSPAGELLLEDENGYAKPVTTAALRGLFRVLRRDIRCVVLNVCFAESQATAIAEHVDCVIGTTAAIGDLAAITFAGAFYQALGYGEDVQLAFDLGCSQIDLASLGDSNVLRLITREGVRAQDVRFAEPIRDRL